VHVFVIVQFVILHNTVVCRVAAVVLPLVEFEQTLVFFLRDTHERTMLGRCYSFDVLWRIKVAHILVSAADTIIPWT
jgi:hypothetical protein